jgi:ADP-heptose:LPS heptosyltransferase
MNKRATTRLQLLRLLGRTIGHASSTVRWPPRVLVLRPDHIGDLLFLFPAMQELRDVLPEAEVTLAVGPWVAPLAPLCPGVNSVETIDYPGFSRRAKGSLAAPYALAQRVAQGWRGRFDVCLVARRDHWWGAMTAALAGVPRRLGWSTAETQPFLTTALPAADRLHEVQANIALERSLVAALGRLAPANRPQPETNPLQLAVPFAAQATADRWLHLNLGEGKPFICVHPGAGAANKEWPLGRYEALLHLLGERTGLPMVVTGSAAEAPLAERVAAASPLALSAAGEFGLVELAGVLSRAALVVGSDSGPLHLAVACDTPTVHVFGPADEAKFGPWGSPRRHTVLTSKMDCRPCGDLQHCAADGRKLSGVVPCMCEISVDQVLQAALGLLTPGPARRPEVSSDSGLASDPGLLSRQVGGSPA